MEPGALADDGGFEAFFYEGTRRGLQVNDVDWRNLLARAHFAERGTMLRDAEPEPETTSPEAALVAESITEAPRFDAEPS